MCNIKKRRKYNICSKHKIKGINKTKVYRVHNKISDLNDIITGNKTIIHELKFYDPVSKLPNKIKFETDLKNILCKKEYGGAILLINIESFKLIYYGYGKEHGKDFLSSIIKFFKSFRNLDIYHFDLDEFVILIKDIETIRNIVGSIKNRFNNIWCVHGYEHYCFVNIGVVIYPKNGRDIDTILKNMTVAVNSAKNKNKDNVIFFRKNEEKKIFNRFRKEQMMRQAVSSGCEQFVTYYQPVINAADGSWVGAEALLRWIHPVDGMISPAEFISMAESIGLMTTIGKHVLFDACKTCKEWIDNGFENMSVSVNLSINQLYEKNFTDIVCDILNQTDLDSSHLTLEITESIAIYDLKKTIGCLDELRVKGISISLDDFGKGYSSLSNLKLLPLDLIKIDRSFISDMNKDNYYFTFIKVIIELAHSIGLQTCCEGIEYEEQHKQLRNLKADFLQGYYFSRPLSKDEFFKKLKDSNNKKQLSL